jgi:predicted transcriptional regulator
MVNRDRHEIAIQILKTARTGAKKTELMRDANLSYAQARLYLGNLLEKGLLKLDEKNRFKTTTEGEAFLKRCEDCPLFRWHKQDKNPLLAKAR